MYLKYYFLLICFYLRRSDGLNDSCIESQCRLLVNESGVPTHDQFLSKASEKITRMVYLNLKIGNDTNKLLDSEDKFFPMRWVWARSSTEHMLSLSYDYDILSLGLLKYQVRNMSVNLIEEPSGCLANLTSTCRDIVVARTLLAIGDVTRDSSTKPSLEPEVVCVAVISENTDFLTFYFEGNVEFQCCKTEKRVNKTLVYCGLGVKRIGWLKAFNTVLNTVTIVILFYWPIIFLVLPDVCFTFREESVVEDELDVSSKNRAVLSSKDRAVESEAVSTEVIVDTFAVDGGKESDARVQFELSSVNPGVEKEFSNNAVDDDQKESNAGDELDLSSENRAVLSSKDRHVKTEEVLTEVTVDTIAVDDVSPITCSDFLRNCAKNCPHASNYFKLFLLWFLLTPMVYYIILVLNIVMKGRYLDETSSKHDAYIQGRFFAAFFDRSYNLFVSLTIVFFMVPGYIMYLVAPSMQGNIECWICKKPLHFRNNLIEHLEMLSNKVYELTPNWSTFEILIEYGPYSILKKCCFCIPPGVSFLYCFLGSMFAALIAPIYGILLVIYGAVCGIICAFFLVKFIVYSVRYLIQYSPTACFLILIVQFFGKAINLTFSWANKWLLLGVIGCLSIWILLMSFLVSLCCQFVVRMFGFIIMGLIFNVKLTAPLISFAFVLANNIYMCYSNVQKRYQEVKEMISEQWVKEKMSPPNADGKSDTIPTDLFFYVCNDRGLLPITGEVCYMLLTIAVISISLFFALAAIIFSDAMYDTSPLISVTAIFITGKIPELFFKGLMRETKFTGKDRINKKEAAKTYVKQFIERQEDCSRSSCSTSSGAGVFRSVSCVLVDDL